MLDKSLFLNVLYLVCWSSSVQRKYLQQLGKGQHTVDSLQLSHLFMIYLSQAAAAWEVSTRLFCHLCHLTLVKLVSFVSVTLVTLVSLDTCDSCDTCDTEYIKSN